MELTDLAPWTHGHVFGSERPSTGERRTRWVVALTLTMMVAEVAAGMAFGSMALLADGWHMGTHAAALGIALFAYVFARRHASDPRFSFGTGKVGALGGFGSAVVLAVIALLILGESLLRLGAPVSIRFEEAIAVAFVGLAVNLVSALLLGGGGHGHERIHADGESHSAHHHHSHDHNLRGAYLHVMADALTSVLAIVALFAGRFLGWTWMDPAMGVVGALVIARWSLGLLRDTSAVLLDAEYAGPLTRQLRTAIEADGTSRVSDLHVWRVGAAHLAAIVSVVSKSPRAPSVYKALLGSHHGLSHVTVEVHVCE